MLVTENLVKQYGDITAVDDVSFSASAGQVFGLLGPNGAGKSTTINCISGLLSPTSGQVAVAGHDVVRDGKAARKSLGVVPQEDNLDHELSVYENLLIYGRYFDLPYAECRRRADELLEFVQLTEKSDSQVEPLSGGMKRRLDLAMSLIHRPQVLFLDEPTTGLDPMSRLAVWNEVRSLNRQGMTIFLTTQYLEEADELANRVAIIDHGRIMAEGTPAQTVEMRVWTFVYFAFFILLYFISPGAKTKPLPERVTH